MKRKTESGAMAEIHRIQEQIHSETKRMSTPEKLAYFRRARKEIGLVDLAARHERNRSMKDDGSETGAEE